jgi:hypothetical protein
VSPPKLTVSRKTAAEMLDMSIDTVDRYVVPSLRVIRAGRHVVIPVSELERWVREHAARVLSDETRATRAADPTLTHTRAPRGNVKGPPGAGPSVSQSDAGFSSCGSGRCRP